MTHRRQHLRLDSTSAGIGMLKVHFAGIPSFHDTKVQRKVLNRSLAHVGHKKAPAIAHNCSGKAESASQKLPCHWTKSHS